MATQNLFEKYGIKEVADVTFYRIEKKEETFESQRTINAASILRGALTKQMVYPLDDEGKGEIDGYEAYVFKDADIIKGYNYDCDDVINISGSLIYFDEDGIASGKLTKDDESFELSDGVILTQGITNEEGDDVYNKIIEDIQSLELFNKSNIVIKSVIDTDNNKDVSDRIYQWIGENGRYTVTSVEIKKDAKGSPLDILCKGETSNTITYDEEDLVQWRAVLCEPKEFYGKDGAKLAKKLADAITLHGGEANLITTAANEEVTINDKTTLAAELVIGAPRDADGDVIRAQFNVLYKDLFEDTGIIAQFTQPRRILVPYDGGYYNNTIVAKVTYTPAAETEDEEAETPENAEVTYTYTFDNAILNGEQLAKIDEILEKITLAYEDIETLDELAANNEKVTKTAEPDVTVDENNFASATAILVEEEKKYKFAVNYTLKLQDVNDSATGISEFEDSVGNWNMDKDNLPGTHEFTYAEQVCMLFARRQNLITKAGTRYRFDNANQLFGNFEFDDNFSPLPFSKEKIVVVGLAGRISENLYDFEEINAAIKDLSDTLNAKAYDVTYTDYAELVVEDEMGFYLPQQLGSYLDRKTGEVTFFKGNEYSDWAKARKGIDKGILSAKQTWGDNHHYSINDAIDALRQERQIIDGAVETRELGYDRVFGGHLVKGGKTVTSQLPLDDIGRGGEYDDYTINGEPLNNVATNSKAFSSYALESVLDTLALLDVTTTNGQLRISSTATIESNRAIYVNPENGALANSAYIYLLKNVNHHALAADKSGIFEFNDKKGNKLFYQDKVFIGTEYLALVVIGTYGIVFAVNRHGTKNVSRVAWMVNDGGYLTDKQAARLVRNGLIHTTDITVNDETFEATCTVGDIKVHRTVKTSNHYIPVLFLDTLKVSTLEQTAEEVYATGGKGNANLIGWDYGKEITLSLEDALFTPASMSAMVGSYEGNDFRKGVKDVKSLDRFTKVTAKRSFIVPAGNSAGTPTEADKSAQAVFYDPRTMNPYPDGTPIAEGEVFYKFTRSVAYDGETLGHMIEISADKFPGTYKIVGDTYARSKETGEDERFQFVIPQAKMGSEWSLTLEADGDPVVFDMNMTVLRPDDGVMVKFIQYNVVENEEQNDGSNMVTDTENLDYLDDAELYKVSSDSDDDKDAIGATEY